MYRNIIKAPAKIEHKIEIFLVWKKIITKIVKIADNNIDKIIGVFNLIFMFLDHFDYIEKNKNIHARITIGINIAL